MDQHSRHEACTQAEGTAEFSFLDGSPDGFALLRAAPESEPAGYRCLYANAVFQDLTGWGPGQCVGDGAWEERFRQVVRTDEPCRFDVEAAGASGLHLEVTAYGCGGGRLACAVRDLTARRRQDELTRRTARLHEMIGHLNRVLPVQRTREDLLRSACQVAVETGGFRYSETQEKAVRWEDGGGAHAALSVRSGGRVVAIWSLQAAEAACFQPEEMRLLQHAAHDVSLALERLESDGRLRTLEDILETTLSGYWDYRMAEDRLEFGAGFGRRLGLPETGNGNVLADATRLIDPAELPRLERAFHRHAASRGAEPFREEFRYRLEDGSDLWVLCAGGIVEWDAEGRPARMIGCQFDITDRKQTEGERAITVELLRLLNGPNHTHELIHDVTGLLQQWSGCEAVGVRLQEGDDFPYFETCGFTPEFVAAETRLCTAGGGPECLCGSVLTGRCEAPRWLYTAKGSFWTGHGQRLPAVLRPGDLPPGFRGRCLEEGYESLALIPLRVGERTLGLLQLNDRRPERISQRQMALLEALANSLAVALDHRQTQQNLRESRERFSLALEAVSDGIFDWNIATGEAYFSDRYWTMLGYVPGARPSNQTTFEGHLLHPDDLPHFRHVMQEYFDHRRESHEVEFRLRTADGGWRWVLSRGQMVSRDDGGRPVRMLGTHVDIEDRRQAAQALIENDKMLREAHAVARLGTYVLDVGKGVWTSSAVLDEIFGIGPDYPRDVEGWHRLLHPEWREKMARYLSADVIGQRGRFDMEYQIRRANDGEERWVHGIGRLDLDEAGRPVRMIGTIRDITESRRAEELLRKSEEKFRGMAEQLAEVLFTSDAEGAFTYVSPAAADVFGHAPEQMLGRRLNEYLADGQDAGAVSCTHPARDVRLRLKRKDGTQFPGEVSYAPVTAGGRISGAIGLIRDITNRVATEEQLRHAQKMESVGRLAGGVAHDFNNLLTVINGYCDLLLSGVSREHPSRRTLTAIRTAGGRAAELTKQLLTFSRRQKVELQPVLLNQAIEECQELLSHALGEDIRLETHLAAGAWPVLADADQIHQVIMNLASNAHDAMPRGGELHFKTAMQAALTKCPVCGAALEPRGYSSLTVRDTGTGMDEHTLTHLFEPFFTTKPVGRGTGLGLATVHGIVQQAGGHICVQSARGRGTTFHLLLPAVEPSAIEEPALAEEEPAGGRESILVVEDQAEVRDFVAEVLTGYGYRVSCAAGGEDALRKLRASRADLVVTDVIMAGMSGVEMAALARVQQPGLKVLYVSGYAQDKIEETDLEMAGTYFLQKPFTPHELAVSVREALGQPARRARVLVVDDEADVRAYFRQVLEEAGYEVEEAGDGREAERRLAVSPIDLVLTDLIMPNQEGIETIRLLRRQRPELGIIAVSGTRWSAFLEIAKALGADATLSKPVDAPRLTGEVRRVLAERARTARS